LRGEEIQLNFLPLSTQEFQFTVWRKQYAGEKKEGAFENLLRKTLPIVQNSLDQRGDYWISFEHLNDFEEFSCKENYNHTLTQDFLYHLLCLKTKKSLKSDEYFIPETTFRKRIYFLLRQYSEGKETVWLRPYYLHSAAKFGFLLDFRFRKNPGIPFSRRIQVLSLSLDKDYKSNRNFYLDKFQKVVEFRDRYHKRLFPVELGGLNIDVASELERMPCGKLDVKTYVFADEQTDSSQFRGLGAYGPLTQVQYPVRLACIFRDKDQTLLDNLLDALKGESSAVNFQGIKPTFRTTIEIEPIKVPDYSQESLDYSVRQINEIGNKVQDELVMPILIVDRSDAQTYYGLKYRLLRNNLPLQVVTVDLLGRHDGLKWSTSNIALQIFAKRGGRPWKVKPTNEKCIIFGIGQSHRRRDGEIIKYFAYSVSIDSSGLYNKICLLGKSDNEREYLEQLRVNMLQAVECYLQEGYQKCVLHVPFKIRRSELQSINSAIEEVASRKSTENIDFLVLKVNTENDFFGYANTNSLVPYESSYLKISGKEYLVWFEGLQYHRETIYRRVGGPIHVEFYWANRDDLNEEDRMKYLQDLLNLSGANWRGFNAKNLPVSIYYCELVADFLERFPQELDNLETMTNPWFL
jgi:hypothetical protein